MRRFDLIHSASTAVAFERESPAATARKPAASLFGHRHTGEHDADDWYALGVELEATAPGEARVAYRKALEHQAGHPDAHLNLGRLLHESGAVEAAEGHYRQALVQRPEDATAAFNLGVALQDLGRIHSAIEAYQRAIAVAPDYADAYFNLAGLFQQRGKQAAAIRSLKTYKTLMGD